MGTPLDDDMVGMLAENETNVCGSFVLLLEKQIFRECPLT